MQKDWQGNPAVSSSYLLLLSPVASLPAAAADAARPAPAAAAPAAESVPGTVEVGVSVISPAETRLVLSA